jgi:carbamoyl-phosphate synthase large subunit
MTKELVSAKKAARILVAGAGGVPTENVIRSWEKGDASQEIVGMGSEPGDLILSGAKRKYLVPYAVKAGYSKALLSVLNKEKPTLTHFQNDLEIRAASRMREAILEMGTKLYMPSKETIEICVDKAKSTEIWMREGIKVPRTVLIANEGDLSNAFRDLGNANGEIWIRATEGGGGKGALPTNDYLFAKLWIDRFKGWGKFTAAELLTPQTVTWLSIWYKGDLVVAQSRKRHSWNMGNRTLSGVTGVTHIGETCSDVVVDKVAHDSILSIDPEPHGIYGVDMTYDGSGFPNPTEINISRFFTTVFFFTKAGLNMPQIFANIAIHDEIPSFKVKINPLPDGLLWIRSMDREPLLTRQEQINADIIVSESLQ